MGVVRLECHECAGTRCDLAGPEGERTWIVCGDCGAKLITFGQLHDEIARQARDYAIRSIQSSLTIANSFQDNDKPQSG